MTQTYEIRALRYGWFEDCTQRESHIMLPPGEDWAQPIDFFVYVVSGGGEHIVVDTGMTPEEGARRGKPTRHRPCDILARIGIPAADVETVVLTHMHFDHSGTLPDVPNATFHVQRAEIDSISRIDMSHPHLAEVYAAEHVCDLVQANFEGRVAIHDGDVEVRAGLRL